jgi:hypothetical protein
MLNHFCSIEPLGYLQTFVRYMNVSWGSTETPKIGLGRRIPKLPLEVQEVGRGKRNMLHNAHHTSYLKIPPAADWSRYQANLRTSTAFESMTRGQLYLSGQPITRVK